MCGQTHGVQQGLNDGGPHFCSSLGLLSPYGCPLPTLGPVLGRMETTARTLPILTLRTTAFRDLPAQPQAGASRTSLLCRRTVGSVSRFPLCSGSTSEANGNKNMSGTQIETMRMGVTPCLTQVPQRSTIHSKPKMMKPSLD